MHPHSPQGITLRKQYREVLATAMQPIYYDHQSSRITAMRSRRLSGTQNSLAASSIADFSSERRYSITRVALANSTRGMVRPKFFAVLRLMTNSNLVGCWTGKSAGLAPLRILPTYSVARR